MQLFYFLVGLGVCVLLALAVSVRNALRRQFALPYVLDEALFNPSQRAFRRVLKRALGNEYRIYGKVHAIDVIGLKPRLSRRDQERAYDRLGDYRFDFLICRRESMAIVCAVNLSPRSRLRKQPPKDTLDRICAAARLPFVRFRESDTYSVAEVGQRLFAAMRSKGVQPSVCETTSKEAASTLPAVITEKQSASRQRMLQTIPERPPSTAAGRSLPRPESLSPSRATKRREPVIREPHVLDEEPTFRIDGDLGDDRPARARRL